MDHARDLEAEMLSLCARAAAGEAVAATTEAQANVLELAARVLSGPRDVCDRLNRAAAAFFRDHPEAARLDPEAMVRRGWILGVPRLRDALDRTLRERR